MRADSRRFFPRIQAEVARLIELIERFLDKPDGALAPVVRLLGCYLKPAVYHVAILCGEDPVDVWLKPLSDLMPALADIDQSSAEAVKYFFASARRWRSVRHDPQHLRCMFQHGVEGLERLSVVMQAMCRLD